MTEVIKSKSMMGVMILILGVAYLSAAPTVSLEENNENNLIVMAEVTK